MRPPYTTMHNYIYQITEELLAPKKWASEYIFMDTPELLPIADSVVVAENRSDAIQKLGAWMEENQLGSMIGESFILVQGAADHHFAGRFEPFHKAAAKLCAMSEQQFIHEQVQAEELIYSIRRSFCDPFEMYVLLDENAPPITMDEFMRTAVPGIRYYIGGVLDYHC